MSVKGQSLGLNPRPCVIEDCDFYWETYPQLMLHGHQVHQQTLVVIKDEPTFVETVEHRIGLPRSR